MIDLSLSQESHEIVTAAADLLDKVAPLDRFRDGGGDDQLVMQLADWGWFAMGVGADAGGFGLGLGEQSLIWIEAGRKLVAPSALATALAARFGPEGLRSALQSGEKRAAFAFCDGAGGHFCLERPGADLLVVVDGERPCFHDSASFTGREVESFDNALTAEQGRIAGGIAASAADDGVAALLLAALLAGAAGGAASLAIDYAGTREQFGQPIGAFQAVKHRCADMGVAGFSAESQVTLAAAALDECWPDAGLELAAAVMQARKAALANAKGGIQVHGGMGFTDECHAHRFFKRAHVLGMILGDERIFSERLQEVG